MDKLTVEVPVKRYLKKYLYSLERIPYDTPIDATKGGHIPIVIHLLFTGKLDLPHEKRGLKDLDDSLPVVLPWWKKHRNQFVINESRVRFLNAFLYRSFLDTLLTKVLVSKEMGGKMSVVIRQEMDELDIVDDFDYDSIKKALHRLRKSRNLPTFNERNGHPM